MTCVYRRRASRRGHPHVEEAGRPDTLSRREQDVGEVEAVKRRLLNPISLACVSHPLDARDDTDGSEDPDEIDTEVEGSAAEPHMEDELGVGCEVAGESQVGDAQAAGVLPRGSSLFAEEHLQELWDSGVAADETYGTIRPPLETSIYCANSSHTFNAHDLRYLQNTKNQFNNYFSTVIL
ncbi:hypothetical protein E4U52_000156 [Claviceps spartinae]|nr:hypothetical protein E4U52_000156 [Claviceps spartinae]